MCKLLDTGLGNNFSGLITKGQKNQTSETTSNKNLYNLWSIVQSAEPMAFGPQWSTDKHHSDWKSYPSSIT